MTKRADVVRTFIEESLHFKYDSGCVRESFSNNCLHQNAIGISIGVESFLSDMHDWAVAFPDFVATVLGLDIPYSHQDKSVPADLGKRSNNGSAFFGLLSSDEISLTPSLEYNFNENFSISGELILHRRQKLGGIF